MVQISWTTPATWSVGESPSAAKLNTNIRDNETYLYSGLATCFLTATVAQTIPNATWTAIAFDLEVDDNGGMHSNTVSNSRITAPVTARYVLSAVAPFDAAANTVALGVRILKNGTDALGTILGAGCGQDSNGQSTGAVIAAAAAGYFELQVWQNSGGGLDTIPGLDGVNFSAVIGVHV